MDASFYLTTYWAYLQGCGITSEIEAEPGITQLFEQTQWEEPQTSLDCNNYAVLALIEAETSGDSTTRQLYLDMAIAALEQGFDHPLCIAHWVLIKSLLGEREEALQVGFSTFLSLLQSVYTPSSPKPGGLIYLPSLWQKRGETCQLSDLLDSQSGDRQSLLLLATVLSQSQLVFYSPTGLRFLHLVAELFPEAASIRHQLGVSSILNGQWEGLLYLHQAHQQRPADSPILQSLYLAYQDLQQPETALFWLQAAESEANHSPESPLWQWAKLDSDSPFTYVTFEDMPLAVEPSFQSIVTSVLLAQGDWFEQEMEFWREQIQPGMTVIDVGANVGVYTLTAAQRVGVSGRVVAVEPFSNCVHCLQETVRLNGLDWVTVCRGAASDRDGTIRLALQGASELNQVITTDEELAAGTYEQVPCFSLDTLIDREKLDRVDFLKMDAEGHELQVLQGSDRLLREFAPVILYENVAGSQGSNWPVAEFLISNGYQLFRYQPYIKQLIPVSSQDDLQGSLNIIALPQHEESR